MQRQKVGRSLSVPIFAVVWVFCALLLSPPAQAQSFQQQMQRAIQLYDQLQFPKALQLLNQILFSRQLPKKQRAQVFLYQGFCSFYVDGPDTARYKIMIALKLDPQLRIPPQTPPPLLQIVQQERAKQGLLSQKKRPLQLDIQPQVPIAAGRPIRFSGTCSPPPRGAKLYVLLRRQSSEQFAYFPLQWKGRRCFGQITNPYPTTYSGLATLEYAFQVRVGTRTIQTTPALQAPQRISFQAASSPTPIAPKRSSAGLIIGVTLGVAAAVAAGIVVTVLVLKQPSGPSIDVRIDITAGAGP